MRSLVVTGTTGGLGPTVVKRLEREYRLIAITHRQADLTSDSQVERAMSEAGEVYGAVHLVGGFDTDPNGWAKMMALNFTAAVNVLRHARVADGGRLVAISSYASLTKPAGLGPYVASKSALNAFVQTIAAEMRPRRITANALLPDDLASQPMRDHVGEAIAFLLSDAAANITGALIPMLA
ncbi:MAG TPA: SDR family NAD(P)-dependent oxidoreductase [Thermoanaerobaculia bacterium]|nr:SDR family NAD(P)-dependent oxidoreductase [Thermoanaerobaculia bacterium]